MAPDDVAAPLHRNLGLHLYRGVEPWRVLCQYMGRVGGTTNGRDSNLRTQDVTPGIGIFAGPSHLPSILPVAVGAALAFRVRGEPRVALGWIGDGSSAHGTAHESMNFAGVRRLPVVFVIDNNQFAYSTPTHLNFAVLLARRARARLRLRGGRRGRHRRARGLPRGALGDRARALGRRADRRSS